MAKPRGKPKTSPARRATAGYSGTPLPKKLGVGPGFQVLLIGAPAELENTLGKLDEGARMIRRTLNRACTRSENGDLVLWFVDTIEVLKIGVRHFSVNCPPKGIWIIWRKKSTMTKEEAKYALTEDQIREVILPANLVDFKVCAVDETWSGLKVTTRRATPSRSK